MYQNPPIDFWQPPLDWSTPGDILYSVPPTMIFNPNTYAGAPLQSTIQAPMNSKTINDWAAYAVLSPDDKQVLVLGVNGA
jgi:hypothetical protein